MKLAGGALPVLGLPGSRLLAAAGEAGLTGVPEAFADRAYTPGGTLVPRGEAGSVVTDGDAVVRRALGFAVDGTVEAVDGSTVAVAARSLCVHGDTPGAARIAARVREALESAGVGVGAFA
ncbi:5-oxoprolinase subunit A OS=Streptomyces fumanus OX=67302 GN=pxpA PE=3 SV=1 [Streptomyces fumanus]